MKKRVPLKFRKPNGVTFQSTVQYFVVSVLCLKLWTEKVCIDVSTLSW